LALGLLRPVGSQRVDIADEIGEPGVPEGLAHGHGLAEVIPVVIGRSQEKRKKDALRA